MDGEIKVILKGNPPGLLMHSTRGMLVNTSNLRKKTDTHSPEDDAELSAYWKSSKKKELCIPSTIIYAAIIRGSSLFKVKGRSVASALAGSVKIDPLEIGLGTDKYEIDSRFVNVGTGMKKAKIIRHRANLKDWKVEFKILFDASVIEESILKNILIETGKKIGIMDYRPVCKGPFGTFEVLAFKRIK